MGIEVTMVSWNYHLGSVPTGYEVPSFPSLYWPINPKPDAPAYLFYSTDIWRFTLFWTLIVYVAFHLAAGFWAFAMHPTKLTFGVPLLYATIGGIEATMSGTIVGFILAAVYNAGYFRMSTWIPFVWSVINVLYVQPFSSQQLGTYIPLEGKPTASQRRRSQ